MASNPIPPPPPGFSLESSVPPPPPGFELEGAAKPATPAQAQPRAGYAESRWTKAPIYIGEIPELGSPGEGISGKYPIDPEYAKNLPAEVRPPQDRGAIYINPDKDPAMNARLIRHETIHNLLDMAGVDIAKVNTDPAVKKFAEPIRKAFIEQNAMGDPDAELPSYMGAYAGDIRGVTPQMRDAYLGAFIQRLAAKQPKAAETLRRMSASPAPSAVPGILAEEPAHAPTLISSKRTPEAAVIPPVDDRSDARKFLETPLVSPRDIEEAMPFLVGPFSLQKGLLKGAAGMTSPESAAIVAGTGGLGMAADATTAGLAQAARVAQSGLSAYFATQAGRATLQTVPEIANRWKSGDWQGVLEVGGQGLLSAAITAASAAHSVQSLKGAKAIGETARKLQERLNAEEAANRPAKVAAKQITGPEVPPPPPGFEPVAQIPPPPEGFVPEESPIQGGALDRVRVRRVAKTPAPEAPAPTSAIAPVISTPTSAPVEQAVVAPPVEQSQAPVQVSQVSPSLETAAAPEMAPLKPAAGSVVAEPAQGGEGETQNAVVPVNPPSIPEGARGTGQEQNVEAVAPEQKQPWEMPDAEFREWSAREGVKPKADDMVYKTKARAQEVIALHPDAQHAIAVPFKAQGIRGWVIRPSKEYYRAKYANQEKSAPGAAVAGMEVNPPVEASVSPEGAAGIPVGAQATEANPPAGGSQPNIEETASITATAPVNPLKAAAAKRALKAAERKGKLVKGMKVESRYTPAEMEPEETAPIKVNPIEAARQKARATIGQQVEQARGTMRADSVEFGKERTSSGKKEFTARGVMADGSPAGEFVTVKQGQNGYFVEREFYKTAPGPENRHGHQEKQQIGGEYTKAEAKQVAEAFLKGQPHPFAAIEAGQPISEYKPGKGQIKFEASRFTGDGFAHNIADGAEVWTNGHVAFKGEAPGPVSTSGTQPDVKRVWEGAKSDAKRRFSPVGAFRQSGITQVVLTDEAGHSAVLSAEYYDFAKKRIPDAIFRGKDGKSGVTVWKPKPGSTPEMVGIIMPMRADELPPAIEKLVKKSRATASLQSRPESSPYRPNMPRSQKVAGAQIQAVRVGKEHAPVVRVNQHTMDLLHEALGIPDTDIPGVTLTGPQTEEVLRNVNAERRRALLKGDKSGAEKWAEIRDVIEQNRAATKGGPMVAFADATALREELNHAIQLKATGDSYLNHLGVEGTRSFLSPDSLGEKAATNLMERFGYSENAPAMVLEIGARLMEPGKYKEMGLSLDEANTLRDQYERLLIERHGVERISKISEKLKSARKKDEGVQYERGITTRADARGRPGVAERSHGGPPAEDARGAKGEGNSGAAGGEGGLPPVRGDKALQERQVKSGGMKPRLNFQPDARLQRELKDRGFTHAWEMTAEQFRRLKDDITLGQGRHEIDRLARVVLASDSLPEAIQHYGRDFAYENPSLVRQFRDVKPDDPVTMYRAVGKGTSEVIRPGDWVALERSYAAQHGAGGFDEHGGSRILKQTAKAKDIAWAGTSADEWVYAPQELRNENSTTHREIVREALEDGKPVPAEVLKDYPDLQNKALQSRNPKDEGPEFVKRPGLLRAAADFLKPVETRIAQEGPAGKELKRKLVRAQDVGEVQAGKRVVALRETGLQDLSRTDRQNLVDSLQGHGTPKNEKVQKVLDGIRKITDEIAGEASAAGVTSRQARTIRPEDPVPPTAKLTSAQKELREQSKRIFVTYKRPFQARANFYPHVIPQPDDLRSGDIRRDVIDNMVRNGVAPFGEDAAAMIDEYRKFIDAGERSKKLEQHLVDSGQARDASEAHMLMNIFRRRVIKRQGSLEYSRQVDLPFYDPDPGRVLPKFVTATSLRLAQIREFGQNDEAINKLIHTIDQTTGNPGFARAAVDRILQKVNEGDTGAARLSRAVRAFNGFKLGLSFIPNATQGALNSLLKSDLPSTIAGGKGLFSAEGRRFAMRSGASLEGVVNEMLRSVGSENTALSTFLKGTGFTASEQANRVWAANAGFAYAKRMLSRLQKDPTDGRARKILTELGLKPDALLKLGKLDGDAALIAAKKFSDITQFRGGTKDLPFFASTSLGKVVFQFKSFVYGQTRLVYDELVGELKAGRPGRAFRTLLLLATAFPIAGEVVEDLRSWATGRERKTSGIKRWLEDIGQAGALGVVYSMLESGGYRKGVEFFAGPTLSEGGAAINIAGGPNKIREAEKWVVRHVPFLGPLFYSRIFPPQAPAESPAMKKLKGGSTLKSNKLRRKL